MIFDRLIWYEDGAYPAALNMAIDEVLLRTGSPAGILRTYGWTRPSISFGYFTVYRTLETQYAAHDLVRRWTGGGLVEHGRDLTYSLIFPTQKGLPRTVEIYGMVHQRLVNALRETGIDAELIAASAAGDQVKCFERPVANDVVFQEVKVAGAAVRRTNAGTLLQGSIQRLPLPPGLAGALARAFGVEFHRCLVPDKILEEADRLAVARYRSEDWTRRF